MSSRNEHFQNVHFEGKDRRRRPPIRGYTHGWVSLGLTWTHSVFGRHPRKHPRRHLGDTQGTQEAPGAPGHKKVIHLSAVLSFLARDPLFRLGLGGVGVTISASCRQMWVGVKASRGRHTHPPVLRITTRTPQCKHCLGNVQ